MDACPDFIGVVKIFVFLELESRYSGKTNTDAPNSKFKTKDIFQVSK
jgi:hypothetical protein